MTVMRFSWHLGRPCLLGATGLSGGRKCPVNALAAIFSSADHGLMRRVVIVAFPGVQTLDVTGPAEVFRAASLIRPPGYEMTVAAKQAGPLRTSTVSLVPDARLDQCRGPIDTLIVAGR